MDKATIVPGSKHETSKTDRKLNKSFPNYGEKNIQRTRAKFNLTVSEFKVKRKFKLAKWKNQKQKNDEWAWHGQKLPVVTNNLTTPKTIVAV